MRFKLAVLVLAFAATGAAAESVQVAVAANFAGTARMLAEQFAGQGGQRLELSSGSTGKFYAQIKNGAPFDVFLSADEATPLRLESEKLAIAGSRFTYAIGRLVLWSAQPGLVDERGEVLRKGRFNRLAIANPKLAPYGAAAQETLEKLGLWGELRPKLVQGENIAQTFQFVSSGNAELGLVALSQIRDAGKPPSGSYWLVPAPLHAPLRQDAVLLARAERNPAAQAFLAYLRSGPARALIRAYGYE
ncbi:MAG TPA: molybdate ABC transporter substrate-binding protein [Burkholderiales bacterium]|nr:molybdate ABC transporter substrate-binding protein [Burkholderiales bacterium]